MNRTLLETARSMLHHTQKAFKFWTEAISSACCVQNRSPTTFLKNVTHYEHCYGKKLDVSHLKVFGWKTYVNVPDAKRKGKFDRKSIPCFVGYPANDKGFKFCNSQTKQMFRSRDVIFLKNKFDVEKLDCTQENFEFFTSLVGSTEKDDAV